MDFSKLCEGLANLEIDIYFKELQLHKPLTIIIDGLRVIKENCKDGKNKTYSVKGDITHDSEELQLTKGTTINYSTYRTTFEKALYKATKEYIRGDQKKLRRLYDEPLMLTITKTSDRMTRIKVEPFAEETK